MNIAIFTNNYLPNPYGVSTSIETFRREFEKRGHNVYVFAPHWSGHSDDNDNIFRYPAIDIKIKFRFPLAIPYSFKISKILKRLKIDVIHAQHPNLLGSAAMRFAHKRKIPLVYTWHTLYDQYAHFSKFIPKKMAVNYIIKKAVEYADKADAVIVPTDSIIPIIRKWGVRNEDVFSVATGVVEKDFQNADGGKIREKYGIAKDETVLILVSRLTEEKNVEFVFRSVEKILKNSDKIKLLVAGGGYLRAKLEQFCKEKKISSKVVFCGVINRNDIKDYLAAADIFVYGSKSETQGMVVSEAMYAGLPIVAVDAPGSKSLIVNDENGFLVEENEEEFSRAVLKIMNNEKLRNEFGASSKKRAEEKFTSNVCAEKMLKIYEETIEKFYSK